MNTNWKMNIVMLALIALCAPSTAVLAQDQGVEATTASGEKVRLFATGRWEYVNEQKAVVQRQAAEADKARERSSQGGFLGLGRRVYEGDKDFNRGSLNPKLH
jgi:hypothetical protein